jgi:NAD-dependent deacetylase
MPIDRRDVNRVLDRLRSATRITVLTGAGVSAASGVPTFRGAGGLWKSFRAEDLATPGAFARDPATVWEWYDWRRQIIARCLPNRAHAVLAAWAARQAGCVVITQNVDGLHERAGLTGALRLHGSIWELACWNGCGAPAWRDDQVPLATRPPSCPACGGLARPGVVWFGEALDAGIVSRAEAATACDVFITAGTSSLVYPAAGLVHEAAAHGAFTVEINPDITAATTVVDVALRGPAEQVFDELEEALRSARQP